MDLPPGGAEAISHEDLRRDVRRLSTEPAETVFVERLGQMQLKPVVGGPGACAEREGRAAGAPLLLVALAPANAAEATAAAGLVSLAKAWDLDGGPPGPRTLCLLPVGSPPPAGAFVLGPLATGTVVVGPSGAAADAADPALTVERINYTEVQARVKTVWAALDAPTTPAPTPRSP